MRSPRGRVPKLKHPRLCRMVFSAWKEQHQLKRSTTTLKAAKIQHLVGNQAGRAGGVVTGAAEAAAAPLQHLAVQRICKLPTRQKLLSCVARRAHGGRRGCKNNF